MKPQYIFLILFALFITGLADGIEAGLVGLGAAPAATIVGAVITPVTAPLGIILGLAVSWCINVTFGAGLLMLMAYYDMWGVSYWKYLFPGIGLEIIPGFDALPFWVAMVILCIIQQSKEEPGTVLGQVARVASAAASLENPATAAGAVKAFNAVRKIQQPQPLSAAEAEPVAQRQVGNELKNVQPLPKIA